MSKKFIPGKDWKNSDKKVTFYLTDNEYGNVSHTSYLDMVDSIDDYFFNDFAMESYLHELLCFIRNHDSVKIHSYVLDHNTQSDKTSLLPRLPIVFEILACKVLEKKYEGSGGDSDITELYENYLGIEEILFPGFSIVSDWIELSLKGRKKSLLVPEGMRANKQADTIIATLHSFAFLYDPLHSVCLKERFVSEDAMLKGLKLFHTCITNTFPRISLDVFERLLRVAEYCIRYTPWSAMSREVLLKIALDNTYENDMGQWGLWLSRRAAARLFVEERYAPFLFEPQIKKSTLMREPKGVPSWQRVKRGKKGRIPSITEGKHYGNLDIEAAPIEGTRRGIFRYLFLKFGVSEEELAAVRQCYREPSFGLHSWP